MVIFGSGLNPPVASSVEPSGIPTRPTVDCAPRLGDEADPVGLDDAVAVVAHVPDAVPLTPAPSNSGVGADVPDITPVAGDSPAIEPPAPVVEFPIPETPACIDPRLPEHAKVVVTFIVPEAEELDAIGLTPGVASSVAPSGSPVTPTGAAGPIPSGEVSPSGGVTGPTPTCADALPKPNRDQTIAAVVKRIFMGASCYSCPRRRSGLAAPVAKEQRSPARIGRWSCRPGNAIKNGFIICKH
jgi:hypothetical protein